MKLKKDNNINVEIFNKYVENKMNDNDFIEKNFSKLFIKFNIKKNF